ncbi:hypothetical protein [Pseudofulvimonas gallinarii]|jgi:hypothetical protein|uniref:Molecular chaperone DnaJ n=1 Tax=Pseudofulvimonas gallinarii TaxID=634155 RepID=A0A4R3LAZ8_9GAMM|nr:hypothetical protein [Pseudofulvimonas gallinarii]TCS96360.1 hypothetical protein EDC25_11548 [Pseudofulvimonas gallinarii]THD14730.1 hypothetical protein B1808_02285 [Pseudofulvimonas gallinarii]
MRIRIATLLTLALINGTAAFADEGDIGYPSVEAARAALAARSDVAMSRADGWLTIEDRAGKTLWTFAPETDPAHPAAVKRSVVEEGDRIVLRMDIRCEGDAAACDALEAHFLSLNESVVGKAREDAEGGEENNGD